MVNDFNLWTWVRVGWVGEWVGMGANFCGRNSDTAGRVYAIFSFFRRINYIQYRRPDVVNVTSNDVVMIFAAAEARSHKRYYNKLYDDNPNLSDSLRQVTFWAYTTLMNGNYGNQLQSSLWMF